MDLHTEGFWTMLLAAVSSVAIATPTQAEVPLAWASVQQSRNQATLVSAKGEPRSAVAAACFCPGDTITTGAQAQVEVLFNDGSLTRVGEQTRLNFWPDTRLLRLSQGTVAVFVPPGQGRTTLETPNARVGLNSNGVVVRYVPSRGLTLVMALTNTPTGPVTITTATAGREVSLYAGQMALLTAADLQVVEFDLREFYQTSHLIAGLRLDDRTYALAADAPLAMLRPDLLAAIDRQVPFHGEEVILDPALITGVVKEAPRR